MSQGIFYSRGREGRLEEGIKKLERRPNIIADVAEDDQLGLFPLFCKEGRGF